MSVTYRQATAAVFALAVAAVAGAHQLTAAFSDTRTISLTSIHTKETLTVTYKRNGRFVPEAMDQIDWIMRDWRRNEKTKMDPETIDILWEIHTELGSKEPIQIICGYRSRGTNEMLRKTVGGQASESQHMTGKAVDVTFPDVPLKQIRYSALIREQGGVGYYPTSGLPFVHIDTGRVRHWPRLPRYELALLFPSGSSLHNPADGGSITRDDVRIAQSQHKDLATQIAGFFTLRQGSQGAPGKPNIQVADAGTAKPPARPFPTGKDVPPAKAPPAVAAPIAAPPELKLAALPPQLKPPQLKPPQPTPPQPKLVAAPKAIERPSRLTLGPSDIDRSQLTTLAAFVAEHPPRLIAEPTRAIRQTATAARVPDGVPPSSSAQKPPTLALDVPAAPRTQWTEVAALDPATFDRFLQGSKVMNDANRSGWSTGWVTAPAYDDEHPEELSYRPFPLAPLLTATASINEPVLSTMMAPDVAKILQLIDKTLTVPDLQFRPGQQTAEVMWAQQFQGQPVELAATHLAPPQAPVPANLIPRAVKTTSED